MKKKLKDISSKVLYKLLIAALRIKVHFFHYKILATLLQKPHYILFKAIVSINTYIQKQKSST